MAEVQEKVPTLQEKITAALDGRTQTWLVIKIKEYADNLVVGESATVEESEAKYKLKIYTDVTLSRKMNGRDAFEPFELKAISKILKVKL